MCENVRVGMNDRKRDKKKQEQTEAKISNLENIYTFC